MILKSYFKPLHCPETFKGILLSYKLIFPVIFLVLLADKFFSDSYILFSTIRLILADFESILFMAETKSDTYWIPDPSPPCVT